MGIHQRVGMQLAAGRMQRFAQQLEIPGAVFVVQEAGQAIVAVASATMQASPLAAVESAFPSRKTNISTSTFDFSSLQQAGTIFHRSPC